MISIIIPAHNEEDRIEKTVSDYAAFFRHKDIEFEIVIVVNASKDRTLEIVKSLSKKYKEITFLDYVQGGKGFAITEGFKYALKMKNDLIGFVDADQATGPEAFYNLIKNINGYDGIIASRWLPQSIVKIKQSFLRQILSRGFNFIVRALLFLPYKDTQCGAKIFKDKALREVINEIGREQWAFDVGLLYRMRKKGLKIKEFPTTWEDKEGSKINVKKVPFQMFSSVIRLRILNSPFKDFIRLYDKMPERLKIHHK